MGSFVSAAAAAAAASGGRGGAKGGQAYFFGDRAGAAAAAAAGGSSGAASGGAAAAAAAQQIPLHLVECFMCSYRNIGRIANLVGVDSLTKLCLDNNRISTMENLSELRNLKWLDLSFNQITVIEGLEGLTKLENLSLFGNQIVTLQGLDSQALSLQTLSLGKNRIEHLDETARYLHRLKNLRALTLLGNRVESQAHYRPRVLAYVRSIKFLDNRLVLPTEVSKAREDLKEYLLPIDDADRREDEAANMQKIVSEEAAVYQHANCPNDATFFNDIFSLEPDGRALLALLEVDVIKDRTKELVDKYREDFTGRAKDMADKMKDLHHKRDRTERSFQATMAGLKKDCDTQCRDAIKEFERSLKAVVPISLRARPDPDAPDPTDALNALRAQLATLRGYLMELEADRLDAHEELIGLLEKLLIQHKTDSHEVLAAGFEDLRQLEKTFQQELKRRIDLWTDERLRAVQDAESGYGSAPDHAGSTAGGKDRQALQVLDNKDDYAKALSDWTDLHVKRLDETEEVHKKNEDRQATTQVAATQKAEHDRSRARVREIHDYVQLSEDRMRRWETLLDATA
jgi:U2 small nuclear ribonucleoprotein A'